MKYKVRIKSECHLTHSDYILGRVWYIRSWNGKVFPMGENCSGWVVHRKCNWPGDKW